MMTVEPPARMPDGITLLGVTEEEWATFPPPARRLIDTLWGELQRLREQVGQTSQNSSKPPSADPPAAPLRKGKPRTGRPAGGQPGHADTNRPLVPPDQVTECIPCRPAQCGHCGHALTAADCADAPLRRQVIEIPPLVAEVTEYQLFTATCPQCGHATPAAPPPGTPAGDYGPRVTGIVALFGGLYHLSQRAIADILATGFQVPISEATVQRLEQTMSAALAAPYQEACAAVQVAAHVHLDETGFQQQRDPDPPPAAAAAAPSSPPASKAATGAAPQPTRAWLWVAVCQAAIVFVIRRSRGSQVVKDLLGAVFAGRITTDRWHAYNWVATLRRQLCWAHLVRDFTAISERDGVAARIGPELLTQAHALFACWGRVRDGTLAFADFQQAMVPIMATVGALLRAGAATAGGRTATTCHWLVQHEDALWTFVRVPGLQPTNNAAEQAIRTAVIWRKLCFGTQTSAGSRYVERVLTVVATCRLQRRPVLEYLIAVATAA